MESNGVYTKVTDEAGNDFYCPLSDVDRNLTLSERLGDECVETEVVHRYSGNIRVVQ